MNFGPYFTGKIEHFRHTVQSVTFGKFIVPFSKSEFNVMNIFSGQSLEFS